MKSLPKSGVLFIDKKRHSRCKFCLKMSMANFEVYFFSNWGDTVLSMLEIFDQLGQIGNFLLVKNQQFGIICNFKKSLKMCKITLKWKELKYFSLGNPFLYGRKVQISFIDQMSQKFEHFHFTCCCSVHLVRIFSSFPVSLLRDRGRWRNRARQLEDGGGVVS